MLFKDRKRYKKECGVYRMMCMKNGRCYFGQTLSSFESRYYDHRYHLRAGDHWNDELQSDFNLYGEDAFIFEVVEILYDVDEIDAAERRYIAESENSYNILPGGENVFINPDREHHTRRKLSKGTRKTTNKNITPKEVTAKMSETRSGQPYTIYRSTTKLNDELVYNIKKLLISGMKPSDVAKEVDVEYRHINNMISNNTWKHIKVDGWDEYMNNRRKTKRLTDQDAITIRDAYANGASFEELGEMYGKTPQSICNIISYRTF